MMQSRYLELINNTEEMDWRLEHFHAHLAWPRLWKHVQDGGCGSTFGRRMALN